MEQLRDLEERIRKKVRRSKIQRIVLNTVATAGVLSVALVAPNVIKSMYKLGIMPKTGQARNISSSAAKLARRGYLRFEDGRYQVTKQGEKLLTLWSIDKYKLTNSKKWDEKWRLVIFDIPERKRKIRRYITDIFSQAGLYRLQDSVWVYPHNCEELIGLLKTDLGVGKDVLYVIADEIENDKYLRSHFDLS